MDKGIWTFPDQPLNEFCALPWWCFHTEYLSFNNYFPTIIKKDLSSLNIFRVRWGMVRDTWTELCFLMSSFFTPVEWWCESLGNRESSHGARISVKVRKDYGLVCNAWIKDHRPLILLRTIGDWVKLQKNAALLSASKDTRIVRKSYFPIGWCSCTLFHLIETVFRS